MEDETYDIFKAGPIFFRDQVIVVPLVITAFVRYLVSVFVTTTPWSSKFTSGNCGSSS